MKRKVYVTRRIRQTGIDLLKSPLPCSLPWLGEFWRLIGSPVKGIFGDGIPCFSWATN